jgi:hypothetical protein
VPKHKLSTNSKVIGTGTGLAYSYERVSDINQVDGDGLERQETACSRFCAKHNLKEAGVLKDKGLSAFHRVHRKKGMLRFFIEARKEGEIPAGSTLVVEHWDRFSRSSISLSEKELHELWDNDLSLSIVSQDWIITEEKYNSDISVSATLKMLQKEANFFSEKLSGRIVDKWQTRRNRYEETGVKFASESDCPDWLYVEEGDFAIEEEYANVVRRIFELASRGKSAWAIAQILNKEEIPTSKGGRWQHGNVSRILRNRQVIGIKKIRKDGEDEIENYFPPIINRALFAKVRAIIDEKTPKKGSGRQGGPNGKCINILKGMTFCSCGAAMTSGEGKGRIRLRCVKPSTECGVKHRSIIYDETLFLSAFMDAQWEKLFKTQIDDKKIRVLTKRLTNETSIADKFEGDLRNLEAKYNNALKSDEKISAKAMNRMEELIEETESQVKSAQRKAETTRQEIKVLEIQADSESVEQRVKRKIKEFLAGDRYDIENRQDFNDWCKTLGISFTFVEAANPVPRIRLSSATGAVEMHLYREDGQAVGDTSVVDMELFDFGDEVIAQRMGEILKVAEPLRHDCPAKPTGQSCPLPRTHNPQ